MNSPNRIDVFSSDHIIAAVSRVDGTQPTDCISVLPSDVLGDSSSAKMVAANTMMTKRKGHVSLDRKSPSRPKRVTERNKVKCANITSAENGAGS